jgi:hemoglobin
MTKKSLAEWYDEKYGKKPSAPAEPAPVAAPEPVVNAEPEAAAAESSCCGSAAAEAEPVSSCCGAAEEPAVEAESGCCGGTAEAEPVAETESSCCGGTADATPSLFEQLGGEGAVNAAVDIFYRKVLNDDRINRFFEGVDMDTQAAKQKAFLTFAFGGPNNYTGLDMRRGHARLVEQGLDDSHFDAVVEDLAATLTELGVPDDLIGQVAAIAESVRNDVLGK